MPPEKAQTPIKKGRGRPPKSATAIMTSSKPATSTTTPSKRGRGRPPKNTITPKPATTTTTASPAKKRGRPSLATTSPAKKPGRASYQKGPARIPSAGIKKRGRPVGSRNAKRSAATTAATKTGKPKAKTPAVAKGGRPKGKHVSNLSSNLKSLISSASKGRLVELLSMLCERNAVVAKSTGSALREERVNRKERNGGDGVVEEGEEGPAEEAITVHASGKTNGVGKAKGSKAKASKDVTSSAVPHSHHISVDEDQQVHTEQGTEPKSGYEADIEPEIPATATEAGEGVGFSQEDDATAESRTIAQVVSSIRDSAFGL